MSVSTRNPRMRLPGNASTRRHLSSMILHVAGDSTTGSAAAVDSGSDCGSTAGLVLSTGLGVGSAMDLQAWSLRRYGRKRNFKTGPDRQLRRKFVTHAGLDMLLVLKLLHERDR